MSAEELTSERGSVYGHPSEDFRRITTMATVLGDCKDPLARHALYMILVKVSRLIQSPEHLDSWNDIQGYARTGKMVMGLED